MLMPYRAMGMTTSALIRWPIQIGMWNSSMSAVDMMLASIANNRKVNEA